MGERIDTDAVLHNAMLAKGLSGEHVDLEGDLFQTTVQKERDENDIFKWVHAAACEGRDEVLKHELLPSVTKALGLLSGAVVAAGIATLESALETISKGDERNEAIKREYGVGACIMLCASALPAGYADGVRQQFFLPGDASSGAFEVKAAILARPDGAQLQQGIVANCRDGQRYALDRHISSASDLTVALKQNPEFAKRYEHDIAFKLGTDSIVWASAHGKLPELEPTVPQAPTRAALEVRG